MRPIIKQLLLLNPFGIVRNGLVAEYRFNEGAGQVLYDYKNNNNGQLGSAAGADTNDPTWTALGLTYATDDYCDMPVPFNVNGDWTIYVVAKRDGIPAGAEAVWGVSNNTTDIPWIFIYKTTINSNFVVAIRNDAATLVTQSVVATNGFKLLALKHRGNNFILKNITDGVSAVLGQSGVWTINKCALGAQLRTTTVNYLNGETAYYLPYNRATSDAEDTQNYRALKTILAGRGVSI